jgi:hypothetical protein
MKSILVIAFALVLIGGALAQQQQSGSQSMDVAGRTTYGGGAGYETNGGFIRDVPGIVRGIQVENDKHGQPEAWIIDLEIAMAQGKDKAPKLVRKKQEIRRDDKPMFFGLKSMDDVKVGQEIKIRWLDKVGNDGMPAKVGGLSFCRSVTLLQDVPSNSANK